MNTFFINVCWKQQWKYKFHKTCDIAIFSNDRKEKHVWCGSLGLLENFSSREVQHKATRIYNSQHHTQSRDYFSSSCQRLTLADSQPIIILKLVEAFSFSNGSWNRWWLYFYAFGISSLMNFTINQCKLWSWWLENYLCICISTNSRVEVDFPWEKNLHMKSIADWYIIKRSGQLYPYSRYSLAWSHITVYSYGCNLYIY